MALREGKKNKQFNHTCINLLYIHDPRVPKHTTGIFDIGLGYLVEALHRTLSFETVDSALYYTVSPM